MVVPVGRLKTLLHLRTTLTVCEESTVVQACRLVFTRRENSGFKRKFDRVMRTGLWAKTSEHEVLCIKPVGLILDVETSKN